MIFLFLFYLVIYLVSCFALLGIFRKAGVPGIFAFIPVFNLIKWLQIVNRPVWWIIFSSKSLGIQRFGYRFQMMRLTHGELSNNACIRLGVCPAFSSGIRRLRPVPAKLTHAI